MYRLDFLPRRALNTSLVMKIVISFIEIRSCITEIGEKRPLKVLMLTMCGLTMTLTFNL